MSKEFLSEFYGQDAKNRKAKVALDDYHFIVECYEGDVLIKTELFTTKARFEAEDLAEGWVNGE